jgi:hypothetical protein
MQERRIPSSCASDSLPASLARMLRNNFRDRAFVSTVRRRFATSPPCTLNDKILYKMAFDRRPLLSLLADKYAVRSYVESKLGSHHLTRVYQVVDSAKDLNFSALPDRFVIKPTHGSCAVIIVDDRAPADGRLLVPNRLREWRCGLSFVRREFLTPQSLELLTSTWLNRRYGGRREWAYSTLRPRLMVEELLSDDKGEVPPDYKFWCFEGRVQFIQVDFARFGHRVRSLHLPDWSPLDATMYYPRSGVIPRAPAQLPQMVGASESLASGLDFARVDLYLMEDRIVFGEITNYPGSGRLPMDPEPLFTALGAAWRPEKSYGPGVRR